MLLNYAEVLAELAGGPTPEAVQALNRVRGRVGVPPLDGLVWWAADRRPTLMQDPVYRVDVAHKAMGYDMPPMTSFYLGVK